MKKAERDQEQVTNSLNFDLIQNVQFFTIQNLQEVTLNTLDLLSEKNPKESQLQFEQFISKYNYLPYDSPNPWNDDVIEYANRRPL